MIRVILILLLIFFVYLIFSVILPFINLSKLKKSFTNSSVIVFGSKGTGKDLLFQCVINVRKKPYFSNIDYGGKYYKISLNQLSLYPNSYDDLINENINRVKINKKMYDIDVYLSDGGVYLPSQYDYLLNKKYPSLSLYYALSRHLYNQNIHINTQNLERIWKALREQSDYYIRCKKAIKIFKTIYIFYTTYDVYQSAVEKLRPLKRLKINKFGRTESDIFYSKYGNIENGYIKIKIKNIKYDTHYFHKYFFNKKYPKKLSIFNRIKKKLKSLKIFKNNVKK